MDASNVDTLVYHLGLTGIPFMNVANGCATGGSALLSAMNPTRAGQYDMGLGKWYGEIGLALTTQFFAMKLQRYMYDHGIGADSLVRVAERAYRNGAAHR